jgi:hypothetical protein
VTSSIRLRVRGSPVMVKSGMRYCVRFQKL